MIRRRIFGISLETRAERRRFVVGFWMVEAVVLAALFQFPMPPHVTDWREFLPLLLTLAVASNLPLVMGGFSFGGAVAFYEGRLVRLKPAYAGRLARNPEKQRRVQVFLDAMKPVDEREAQLRDWAHHRANRLLFWALYAGAVAYLALSAMSLTAMARFGFVLLELLLVMSMALPQSLLLWTLPELECGAEAGAAEAGGGR